MTNEDRVWNLESDKDGIVQDVQRELSQYCEDLEIEVSNEEQGQRELIISAGGDATLFPNVEDLVANAPELARWKILALKPPRGFEFELDCGIGKIVPEELFFEPLSSGAKPNSLGILVFVPEGLVKKDIEQYIRLVVETGLGERDAAVIEHIEVAPMPEDPSPYLALPQLGEYVKWFTSKKPDE